MLNESSCFPPFSIFSQSSAYLYCLKNSFAVKFCRSSLHNFQAWVAVSILQWTCRGCFYSSPVCCDNGFWYLLRYLLCLSGTARGIVTDEAVLEGSACALAEDHHRICLPQWQWRIVTHFFFSPFCCFLNVKGKFPFSSHGKWLGAAPVWRPFMHLITLIS